MCEGVKVERGCEGALGQRVEGEGKGRETRERGRAESYVNRSVHSRNE